RDFVRSYNQRHDATVLLTSHYMDDVVALCPRIIVIDQGKLIHDGDLRQLIKTMDPDKRVSFTLTQAIADDELARLGPLLARDGVSRGAPPGAGPPGCARGGAAHAGLPPGGRRIRRWRPCCA